MEYCHLFTSENCFALINQLSEIDSQYFLEGNLILMLLKRNLIAPLTFNYNFTDVKDAGCSYVQLYRAYQFMQGSPYFKEILEESLPLVNFSRFFAFAIIDR